jgi:hypothetical protein
VLDEILRALVEDLKEHGGLDLSECFIDGTFVSAKKAPLCVKRRPGASSPNRRVAA